MRGSLLIVLFAWLILFTAMLFRFHPTLDLAPAQYFYNKALRGFSPMHAVLLEEVKHAVYLFNDIWIPSLILGLILGSIPALRSRAWGHTLHRWRKAMLFLLLTMAIAAGGSVELAKSEFGRPRPRDIMEFSGTLNYTPPLVRSHQGGKGFYSGHAATGFALCAFAYLARRRRALIYMGGLALGTAIGLTRMALGAHFASDVIFACLFTLLWIHLIYLVLYRKRCHE